ncbi:uncharacterized protein LOC103311505 [Acyrthosiphon pisum]|uniref:Uncharacterized protein n=1 Tax=Acyrthosiphon pisum TaxID=7029 RepID=A0A8R2BA91_ACYPI|nr:uncharacterized protein LOC103311505 [Acyrthosiphon pisum]|eukprot:XP_008189361.1 PREDICTED: uncharacterized protein LOC103311505 [Acyrthosiphon pisum]
MLGFIKRISSEFNMCSSLKALYCAFVRSHLEYGVVIWDPQNLRDSCQIERVQRKFLKYASFVLRIDCLPHDYTPVLEKLNLETLSTRKTKANLVFLSKLLSGEVDAPDMLGRINFNVPGANFCNFPPFRVPFCATNYLYNEPILRMMTLANGSNYI